MSRVTRTQKSRVFFAARDGMARTVCASLIDKTKEQIKELLEQEMYDEEGQRVTPLIVAARNGHDNVVKVLIQKFQPNIEHEGSVKVDGYIIEGAPALWCAAGAGHLNVVKTLVKAGANVNHATVTNSTPLRAACFNGRLDVIKYLTEHNGNIHIANKYNNTCLMIAAYKGHLEVVSYLLEKGVNPDEQAHCGATALLFASESGHAEVVMELLKYGASLIPNQFGMTPVLGAAERTRSEVVEYFITRPELTIQEKVDAMELLGASYANDKDHYCLERAFYYLQRAMALRFEDDENILVKPYYPPVPAYENWIECQSLQQLELIRYNENALHMESLTIRERIMGTNNPEVPHSVVFRGAVFADHARFDRCIELWLHALHLSQLNDLPVVKDLLRFAQVFSQMVHIRVELSFSHVESVLAAAVLELERNKEKILKPGPKDEVHQLKEDMESNVITALYILVILTKLMKSCDPAEEHRVHQLVFRLNKLQVASRHGQTLLHLCVNSETPVDNFHTNDVCKFPCSATAKLLIQCGADVNAMDYDRNTPLHIIASYGKHIGDFMTLHSIIMELTEAGAHMDTVNMKGKTPFETATTGEAEIILRTQIKLSLKCLAARAIQDNKIPYKGHVPGCLESFIQLHGSGANELSKEEENESRW